MRRILNILATGVLLYLLFGLIFFAFFSLAIVLEKIVFGGVVDLAPSLYFLISTLFLNLFTLSFFNFAVFIFPYFLLIIFFGMTRQFVLKRISRRRTLLAGYFACGAVFLLVFYFSFLLLQRTRPRHLSKLLAQIGKYPESTETRALFNAFPYKETNLLWGGVSTRDIYLEVYYDIPAEDDPKDVFDYYTRRLNEEGWQIKNSYQRRNRNGILLDGYELGAKKDLENGSFVLLGLQTGEAVDSIKRGPADDACVYMRVYDSSF